MSRGQEHFAVDPEAPTDMSDLLIWAARKVAGGRESALESKIVHLLEVIEEKEKRRWY